MVKTVVGVAVKTIGAMAVKTVGVMADKTGDAMLLKWWLRWLSKQSAMAVKIMDVLASDSGCFIQNHSEDVSHVTIQTGLAMVRTWDILWSLGCCKKSVL